MNGMRERGGNERRPRDSTKAFGCLTLENKPRLSNFILILYFINAFRNDLHDDVDDVLRPC